MTSEPKRCMKFTMDPIESLYEAIQTRPRPEDVAQIILRVLDLPPTAKAAVTKAASGSFKQGLWAWSSMARDFARPVGAERQVHKAAELFAIPDPPSDVECLDPKKVEAFLTRVSPLIHREPGEVNFLSDRLDRAERKAAGLGMKKRQYNKRWRLLKRMEDKISRMVRNHRKYEFTRIGKSALATRLTKEDLAKDLPTACFVAYLSARMNMRSTFTNGPQDRAFDEVSEALFKYAIKGQPNWWCLSHVHPEENVLRHLSEDEKGRLVGAWFAVLNDVADLLAETWQGLTVEKETLIVQRGSDSSTWNQTAGAWNKAREHWIALLYELDMAPILDAMCPGKVLRLMAADVARWHKMSGGDLHPDTKVWAELPLPWDVLRGRAQCTRDFVQGVCTRVGVKSEGWVGPKPPKKAVPYKPTPELVNGVTVFSPVLASILRKAGWFSGKGGVAVDVDVKIVRDEHGAALRAEGLGV